MKPDSRLYRWLPRFSLSNLLMLMVIIGLCLAWYDQRRKLGEQAEVIEKQRLEITRLTVNNIIRSDMSDAQKLTALEPFVKLHDSVLTVAKWARGGSPPLVEQLFDGGFSYWVTFSECDLWVRCGGDDDVVYALGYVRSNNDGERVKVELIRDTNFRFEL